MCLHTHCQTTGHSSEGLVVNREVNKSRNASKLLGEPRELMRIHDDSRQDRAIRVPIREKPPYMDQLEKIHGSFGEYPIKSCCMHKELKIISSSCHLAWKPN
ncbi:hypothetical protein ACOSQ2_031543 [Xanthoceras sorbifolium]